MIAAPNKLTCLRPAASSYWAGRRVLGGAELATVLAPEEQAVILTALNALSNAAIRLDPHSQARWHPG